MTFIEELRSSLATCELRAEELRPQLKRTEDMVAHLKALIADEERQGGQVSLMPIIPESEPTGRETPISRYVGYLLNLKGVIRFRDARAFIAPRKFPGVDLHEVGKQVAAGLARAVKTGKAERVVRGVYRRRSGVVT